MPSAEKPIQLEPVLCPICGVDESRLIYPSRRRRLTVREDEFRASGDTPLEDPLVQCRRCGMKYVTPRVSSAVVLDGYATAVDEMFVSQAAARERTFAAGLRFLQQVWGRPPGRLLDVGTAGGSFLKVARDAGWQVWGCEPNRWLCDWCQRHYGISLTCGTIFDVKPPEGGFDLITLWDVLEHVSDPLAVLKECNRLLAPEGLLAVNYPDIGTWIARLMGRRWPFLISVHPYYFTRETMALILKESGFRLESARPHIQMLEIDYLLFRAEPLFGPAARLSRRILGAVGLKAAQIPYWMGQAMAIARRERESA